MPRQFAAIALCILAQGAAAQCVGTAANPNVTSAHPAPAGEQAVRAGAATAPAQPPARAELIKTAAAGTRDDAPPVAHEAARSPGDGQDHPRRGGTAMLLAALALMSGIALRRYGAHDA